MATNSIKPVEQKSVYGFVKGGKSNKDKSISFRVGKRKGMQQKFVLPELSTFANLLKSAQKAYVRFEVGEGRNPRVLEVVPDPSASVWLKKMES
jgi:hypothetical protein